MMPHRLCLSIDGSGASRDILVATRPLSSRSPFLPECHHPFGLPRPTTAPTAAAKRELSLANAMGQLDASDRDGRVRERLEPSHRRTASLARPMILRDDVVQIFAGPHLDVPPARMLSAQQPQCAPTRHMTVESHFAWDACSVRRERLAKECLCGRNSTVAAQQEIDGLALLVDRAVKVVHFALMERYVSSTRHDV